MIKIKNKTSRRHALRIAVEITVLAILLLAGEASALSNDGGGSWQYFKDLTITNTGSPLSDYQVLVNLKDDNFPPYAKNRGEDIRFIDAGGNELSYWIESWDNSSKTASIWVKVPSIITDSSTIMKMYYGNPNAISSSNGDKTFEFFDDFSDGKYDTNPEWSVEEGIGYWSANSNELVATISGNNHFDSIYANKTLYNQSISMRFKSTTGGNRGQNWPAIYPIWNGSISSGSGYYLIFYWSEPWAMEFGKGTTGRPQVIKYAAISPDNEYHNFKINIYDGRFKIYLDDMATPKIDIVDKQYSISDRFYLRKYGDMGAYYSFFDDIRVRKYASPEPSVIVGGETPNAAENFTIAHITDVHIGYYIDSSGMEDSVNSFTDTVEAVKSAHPNRILITGDLVQYDNKDFFIAFKNLLRGIWIPYNTTPGNHDRRDTNFFYGNNLSDYNLYIKPMSNPTTIDNNYSFDFKGYRFIGLDSGADYNATIGEVALGLEKIKNDLGPESDGLSKEQIWMLNDKNQFNNSAPKIIFLHHPVISSQDDYNSTIFQPDPVPNDGAPGGNDNTIAFNRWNFMNYTRDSNVQLVLTGHSHENAIFDVNGNPAENNSLNRPLFIQTQNAGYRIIEIKDGKANPHKSETSSRFIRTLATLNFWQLKNPMEINSRMGIHMYDFYGGHTGMLSGCSDFGLGLNSYYTGDYGGSFTPQVIVSYHSLIKDVKVFSCQNSNGAGARSNTQSFATIQNTQSQDNIFFNLSLDKQKKEFTTEMSFHNVNVTESSIATVNVSDEVKYYIMDLDLDGDGTTDRLIYPDFIDTILAQPKNNIDVIAYNGAGTINLASGSGYFIKATSLNASLINGGPDYDFPYGLLAFNISGMGNGETVDVTIVLPQNLSSTARYWNYGATSDIQTPHWYQIPIASNEGDNAITIQLQDGGIGDNDLKANGIIISTGGPGIPHVGKVTGGGWITNQAALASKNKATFAFEARFANGTPIGNFEYSDPASNMKLKSDVSTFRVGKEIATFGGFATINGAGAYAYTVTVVDKAGKDDTFTISIPSIAYLASGTLGGGNIQIHDKD